jgi:hypothetical protein
MDPDEQRRWLRVLADAAEEEGCMVAPVGSVYLMLQGRPRLNTKDLDGVIHSADLDIASLDVVKRIARRLGEPEVSLDKAVVAVTLPSGDKIELIRGRSAAKGGFFPRELLRAAAQTATVQDGLLVYRREYMIVLKADAAIDRRDRAARDAARGAEHLRRAAVFEADVFAEVQRANAGEDLDGAVVAAAVRFLKASRRTEVTAMLRGAGVDLEGTLK